MSLIKVILGSTRPNRFGIQPAEWLMDLAKEHSEATFELVDLKDMDLPLLDEALPAAYGKYDHDHTKAWAKVIAEADGFVFVTGEYNFSIPGAFKNALDFLAAEWRYKPVAFVSYGAAGGGLNAVVNWRNAVANLSMYDLRDHVSFVNYFNHLDSDGKIQPSEEQTATAHKLLTNIAFWSDVMKPAREELAAKKEQ
jgi:NAD(P)H-dependent FMN reductase